MACATTTSYFRLVCAADLAVVTASSRHARNTFWRRKASVGMRVAAVWKGRRMHYWRLVCDTFNLPVSLLP